MQRGGQTPRKRGGEKIKGGNKGEMLGGLD